MGKENGFRKGKKVEALEKIRATLTDEELHRLQETKKFDSIKPGSISYKLALHQDQLRVNLRNEQFQVKKILWNIANLNNQVVRAKFQLSSKNITEELSPGVVMSEDELNTHIKYMGWSQLGEITGLAAIIMKIRGIVGHYDIEREIIITEEQFDEYVAEIETEIQKFGFKLFE